MLIGLPLRLFGVRRTANRLAVLSQGSETSGADATTQWPIKRFSERASAPRVSEPILRGPASRPADVRDTRLQRAERLAADCDAWLRRLRPVNPCLRRSLLLLALLRRDGIAATLVIGIRTDRPPRPEQAALAHAWLELDGRPILERVDPLLLHRPSVRYPNSQQDSLCP